MLRGLLKATDTLKQAPRAAAFKQSSFTRVISASSFAQRFPLQHRMFSVKPSSNSTRDAKWKLFSESNAQLNEAQMSEKEFASMKRDILAACEKIYQAKIAGQDKLSIYLIEDCNSDPEMELKNINMKVADFLRDCLGDVISVKDAFVEEFISLPSAMNGHLQAEWKDWQKLLYQELKAAYQKAQEKIEQDFCSLKNNLYNTLVCTEKNDQFFMRNDVCLAAFNQFKKFVSDNGGLIRVYASKEFIVAEHESPGVTQARRPGL